MWDMRGGKENQLTLVGWMAGESMKQKGSEDDRIWITSLCRRWLDWIVEGWSAWKEE